MPLEPPRGPCPALLEHLETAGTEPDEGIWEVRGPRRHFTHSKVMAWWRSTGRSRSPAGRGWKRRRRSGPPCATASEPRSATRGSIAGNRIRASITRRPRRFLTGLADILVEQGRYEEAERLLRISLEINQRVGVIDDSQSTAQMLAGLAGILNLQHKFEDASAVYATLDKAIASWEPQRREALEIGSSRVYSLYASGQVEAGIVAAQVLLKRQIGRVGEKHFDTATARGTLAIGYVRAGKEVDAAREFKAAIPLLMAAARENADNDDTTVVAARRERLQNIVEAYIGLLAKTQKDAGGTAADETFQLADAVRGHSVQNALAASSARMRVKDPALSELIRKEQDLTMQVNALLGTLNNTLALTASERDEEGVQGASMRRSTGRAPSATARATRSHGAFRATRP